MIAFFDTNILIYGLVPGAAVGPDREKRAIAVQLLDQYAGSGELAISTQVMSEFFVVATRKSARPLTAPAALLVLQHMSLLHVVAVDKELVLQATIRMIRSRISYWDALIVEAALHAGASILYTEDLQHGMRFDALEVRNPFLVSATHP